MCCVIKILDIPLFMIRVYSGGMKAADLGQKVDKIWTKAAALGQKVDKLTKFGFFAKLS